MLPGRPVRQLYLSCWPARLHRLAESIPWNRFLGSLKVNKFGLWIDWQRHNHGRNWRTKNCRLCINFKGTCVRWAPTPTPPPISRNNLCKDDSALFSRFLHGHDFQLSQSWTRQRRADNGMTIFRWSTPQIDKFLVNMSRSRRLCPALDMTGSVELVNSHIWGM